MASKKLHDDHTCSCRKALPPEDADYDGVAGIEGVKGVAADSRDNSGDDDGEKHLQKHGSTQEQSCQRMVDHTHHALQKHQHPASKEEMQAS